MRCTVVPHVVGERGAITRPTLLLGTLLLAALSSLLVMCHDEGFQCGTPLPSDSTIVRTCNRAREVCVCETNSCATRVDPSDCPSGLRYTEGPFARADLAGACAELAQPQWLVTQAQPSSLCPVEAPDGSAAPAGTGGTAGAGGTAGSAPHNRRPTNEPEEQSP